MTSQQESKSLSKQELLHRFKTMRLELQQIAKKLGELESERDEHKLVLDNILPMEPERKCFRLINGVLVERTVKEVIPDLQMQHEQLGQIMENMVAHYKKVEKEMVDFQKDHDIRIEPAK